LASVSFNALSFFLLTRPSTHSNPQAETTKEGSSELLKGGVEKQHAKRFVIRFCLAREPLSWPSDKFVLPTQVFCAAAAAFMNSAPAHRIHFQLG